MFVFTILTCHLSLPWFLMYFIYTFVGIKNVSVVWIFFYQITLLNTNLNFQDEHFIKDFLKLLKNQLSWGDYKIICKTSLNNVFSIYYFLLNRSVLERESSGIEDISRSSENEILGRPTMFRSAVYFFLSARYQKTWSNAIQMLLGYQSMM